MKLQSAVGLSRPCASARWFAFTGVRQSMCLLAGLDEFVHDHRPHGPLTADVTEPARNGYLLTVACPCGVFERWVTPTDAELDLLRMARLN